MEGCGGIELRFIVDAAHFGVNGTFRAAMSDNIHDGKIPLMVGGYSNARAAPMSELLTSVEQRGNVNFFLLLACR